MNLSETARRWGLYGLRHAEQACSVALLIASLGVLVATWIYQGGLRGRLIEVDKASKRPLHFQLDVNHADWPEWTLLPGVGETLAKRIVAAREGAGGFRHLDDLLRVRGIGPKTLERMRPYLLPVEEPVVPSPASGGR